MAIASPVQVQPDPSDQPDPPDQTEAETSETDHLVEHQEGVPRTDEEHTPATSTPSESNGSIKASAVTEKQKQRQRRSASQKIKSSAGALWQKVKQPFQALKRWTQKIVWFWEIFSCTIASIALAAIFITLAVHEHKTLPHWPFEITINALIAVFTAILKAAVILPVAEGLSELKWMWFSTSRPLTDMDRFDQASRGPWGSFLLFFLGDANGPDQARHGAWRTFLHFFAPIRLLIYLGALITVVALAIDPFSQQVLQYFDCMQEMPNVVATISRTNNYTTAGFPQGALEASLDPPMAAALYQGTLNPAPNATASIEFGCQSGNCTFSDSTAVPYRSLAMCSSVEDISLTISGNGSAGYYTLPSNLSIGTGDYFTSGGDGVGSTEDAPLFSFEAIMLTNRCIDTANLTAQMECQTLKPWAFRASLYPCIHTYGKANITRSILQEEILSTVRVPFMNMDQGFYFSLVGNYPSHPGIDCTGSSTPTHTKTIVSSSLNNGQRYYNRSLPAVGTPDTLWYDPGCSYEFAVGPVEALTPYLGNFFGYIDQPQTIYTAYGDTVNTVGYPWVERLYANGTANLTSVANYMQGLANTITSLMRQRGDDSNSAPAIGTMLYNTTCIRVRWQWLSLPAALLFLTWIFLLTVASLSWLNTRQKKVALEAGAVDGGLSGRGGGRKGWKSSTLPLLWCGLDEETKTHGGTLNDLATMEDRSAEVEVMLDRKDNEYGGGGS